VQDLPDTVQHHLRVAQEPGLTAVTVVIVGGETAHEKMRNGQKEITGKTVLRFAVTVLHTIQGARGLVEIALETKSATVTVTVGEIDTVTEKGNAIEREIETAVVTEIVTATAIGIGTVTAKTTSGTVPQKLRAGRNHPDIVMVQTPMKPLGVNGSGLKMRYEMLFFDNDSDSNS
jgi:orotidine-5'-phosphate decarboxylase